MFQDFLTYLEFGFNHIVTFKGYDHIIFLIVLSVPYEFKDWKRVFTLISLFTIAHSITLLLSIYNIVHFDHALITFLMPITILIAAIFNVFSAGKKVKQHRINILLLATVFLGMMHGFAFATDFASILGSGDNKMISLVEFGLGIELGQMLVVFLFMFLGFLGQTIFRFSTRDCVMVMSSIVIGLIIPIIWKTSYLS